MRVAIVDVGANTLRLLVATRSELGRVEALREDRRQLGLGEEIERNAGVLGAEKLEDAGAVAAAYVSRARKLGAEKIEILVTSPGRQAANGAELVETLKAATSMSARVVEADEEGVLAWRGAIAATEELPQSVAVCDIGGGSVQLVVGTLADGPAWCRSVDIGSLRLTQRTLRDDPPNAEQLTAAGDEVSRAFADVAPPVPQAVLSTGGTARALRRICGAEVLGEDQLHTALETLAKRSSREISKEFGVQRARARTITAGTILLLEVQRRFGTPLLVARGGLREGAALSLLSELAAATA